MKRKWISVISILAAAALLLGCYGALADGQELAFEQTGGEMSLLESCDSETGDTTLDLSGSAAPDSPTSNEAAFDQPEVEANDTPVANHTKVFPPEGYYKIVGVNGHGKGQELYFHERLLDNVLDWRDDGDVWYIRDGQLCFPDPSSLEYHVAGIYGSGHTVNSFKKTKEQDSRSYCTHFEFYSENDDDSFDNMTIWLCDSADRGGGLVGKLNRHKVYLGEDYVTITKDVDNNNKLWKLVPVTYTQGFNAMRPTLNSAQATANSITVSWKKFKRTDRTQGLWNNISLIEIQCSTDKSFKTNVVTKKISKGKTKQTIKKLKPNTVYYLRIRYADGKGVYSKWSKVKKIRTKKK